MVFMAKSIGILKTFHLCDIDFSLLAIYHFKTCDKQFNCPEDKHLYHFMFKDSRGSSYIIICAVRN